MKRVLFALVMWLGLAGVAQAGSIPTGIWWDPEKGGLGVMVFESGTNTLVYFYTYDKFNSKPTWLLGVVPSNATAAVYSVTFKTFRNVTNGLIPGIPYDPSKLESYGDADGVLTINGSNSMTLKITPYSNLSYWGGTLNLVPFQ